MRPGFLILSALAGVQLPAVAQDSFSKQALTQLAGQASKFWQTAPDYMAREKLTQKAIAAPKRRLHIGASAVKPPQPELKDREMVSYYALSSFKTTPEALHEFRELVSIDGKVVTEDQAAREKFRAVIRSGDDRAKKELLAGFEKAGLAVSATDFGQLLLLFTRVNLGKYSFQSKATELVGADRAIVIDFHQNSGHESLKIVEPGRQAHEPLSGQLWVRESDFMPLRITLNAFRRRKLDEIRDEARVDYVGRANATILPVSVVYRRYVNGDLHVENIYEYSDWQPVNAK